MSRPRKPSPQARTVLGELAGDADRWWHGYELSRRTGIASGTLYPILIRLADRGVLESTWETPTGGRPPRHLYRLTRDGLAYARSVTESRSSRRRVDIAREAT